MATHSLIIGLLLTAQADMPLTVDARKQLFLDDFIVAEAENVTRQIHPAEKYSANPVIRAVEAWENPRVCIYGSVLRDGGKYRAWYYAGGDVAYAESTDGVDWDKPKLPVNRRDCLEVVERVNYQGDILQPLDEAEAREVILEFKRRGIEAIAVCFLFSYLHPQHELRMRELIQELYPEAYVSLSHEVYPRWREYERASTTILDAFLKHANVPSHVSPVLPLSRLEQSCHTTSSLGSASSRRRASVTLSAPFTQSASRERTRAVLLMSSAQPHPPVNSHASPLFISSDCSDPG